MFCVQISQLPEIALGSHREMVVMQNKEHSLTKGILKERASLAGFPDELEWTYFNGKVGFLQSFRPSS